MKKLVLAITLIAMGFTACGPRVTTTKEKNVNLEKFNTFAYLPNSSLDIPKENYGDESVNELVIKTINANLQKAGYAINRNNPDLLVLVSSKVNYDEEATEAPMYASYPYVAGATTVSPFYNDYYYNDFATFGGVAGYNTDNYSYKEGTVVVDIIERETKESVWKGSTSESIYDAGQTDAIAMLVNEIFKEFPLKK